MEESYFSDATNLSMSLPGAEERRSGGAEERRSGGAEERRRGGVEERRSGGACTNK